MAFMIKALMWGIITFGAAPVHAHTTCGAALHLKEMTQWSGKTVILDTNVVIHDPQALYKFPGAHIILPGTLIDELDPNKSDEKNGFTTRTFVRNLLQITQGASVRQEIPIDNSGTKLTFAVEAHESHLSTTSFNTSINDNKILATALAYKEKVGGENLLVISDDGLVLIKAFILGMQSRPFRVQNLPEKPERDASDLHEFELTDEQMQKFLNEKVLPKPSNLNIGPNEFVRFYSRSIEASDLTIGRYHYDRENPISSAVLPLPDFATMKNVKGQPRNLEQKMALDVMIDDSIDCVFLIAKAGTGKTYLTMLALLKYIEEHRGAKGYLSKPTRFVGENNPGALPGGIDEKYSEWKRSYLDNLSQILSKSGRKGQTNVAQLDQFPHGIELLPFEFIRGRSLTDSFVVIDEFQNTNIHEAKTFLTRIGERSKIILLGDPSQIDAPASVLNLSNNGLSYAGQRLTRPGLALDRRSRVAIVRLTKSERSEFVDMVADEL